MNQLGARSSFDTSPISSDAPAASATNAASPMIAGGETDAASAARAAEGDRALLGGSGVSEEGKTATAA